MRGPRHPFETRSSAVIGTGENLRIVSAGPRSERGGMIAWTRLPSGSRASAQGDDSSTRRPSGPTIRSIRCRTASSPSNKPSGALSIRPSRSTYTSSGPFTITSVTSGSFNRNSIGPNPTTSSETSLTIRVSSRCGRMAPLARSSASASSRTRSLRSVRGAVASPRASTRSRSCSRSWRRTPSIVIALPSSIVRARGRRDQGEEGEVRRRVRAPPSRDAHSSARRPRASIPKPADSASGNG